MAQLQSRDYAMISRICRQTNADKGKAQGIDRESEYHFAIATNQSEDRAQLQTAWEGFVERMVQDGVFANWGNRMFTEHENGVDTDYMIIRLWELERLHSCDIERRNRADSGRSSVDRNIGNR